MKGADLLSGTHLDTRHFLLEFPCHPGESTTAARSDHNHINFTCGAWHTHKVISQWTSMYMHTSVIHNTIVENTVGSSLIQTSEFSVICYLNSLNNDNHRCTLLSI